MSTTISEIPTMRAFDVEVRAVRRLGPSFVRVTFAGEDLRHIGTGGPAGPRDLRVKLLIPTSGHPLPDLNAWGFSQGWYREWLALDETVRGAMRTYTVRAMRPALGELDVDFVLHAGPGGADGPAAAWASAARPGDRLTVVGPDGRHPLTVGIEWDPGECRRVLLAGDETAVPAVAAILEGLGPDVEGEALLEVPHADDRQEILTLSRVKVTWLAREGRAHGTLLQPEVHRAVRLVQRPVAEVDDIDVDAGILWDTPHHPTEAAAPRPCEVGGGAAPCLDERCYAWIAGEAGMVRDLRRHLVGAGFPRCDVAFMGYWRRGRAELT
ncbi:siderophore-interacting protein [Georgenia faecalis]|uniref:Siderophore-interacting protein n=1 Tax=Georgenia faecalis TaxID=2483799 RepID=A0ABV9D7U9_9MICO|nr:siderophore-interacting protein [Georgenia faecalis]